MIAPRAGYGWRPWWRETRCLEGQRRAPGRKPPAGGLCLGLVPGSYMSFYLGLPLPLTCCFSKPFQEGPLVPDSPAGFSHGDSPPSPEPHPLRAGPGSCILMRFPRASVCLERSRSVALEITLEDPMSVSLSFFSYSGRAFFVHCECS